MNEPLTVSSSADDEAAAKTQIAPPPPQRTLMFVESNVDLQNILRERLKNNGYRVLVTADPDRALEPIRRRRQGGRLRDLQHRRAWASRRSRPSIASAKANTPGRFPRCCCWTSTTMSWKAKAKL